MTDHRCRVEDESLACGDGSLDEVVIPVLGDRFVEAAHAFKSCGPSRRRSRTVPDCRLSGHRRRRARTRSGASSAVRPPRSGEQATRVSFLTGTMTLTRGVPRRSAGNAGRSSNADSPASVTDSPAGIALIVPLAPIHRQTSGLSPPPCCAAMSRSQSRSPPHPTTRSCEISAPVAVDPLTTLTNRVAQRL
jgi:hypothetical protein